MLMQCSCKSCALLQQLGDNAAPIRGAIASTTVYQSDLSIPLTYFTSCWCVIHLPVPRLTLLFGGVSPGSNAMQLRTTGAHQIRTKIHMKAYINDNYIYIWYWYYMMALYTYINHFFEPRVVGGWVRCHVFMASSIPLLTEVNDWLLYTLRKKKMRIVEVPLRKAALVDKIG